MHLGSLIGTLRQSRRSIRTARNTAELMRSRLLVEALEDRTLLSAAAAAPPGTMAPAAHAQPHAQQPTTVSSLQAQLQNVANVINSSSTLVSDITNLQNQLSTIATESASAAQSQLSSLLTAIKNDLSLEVKMNKKLSLAAGFSVLENTKPPAGLKRTDTITQDRYVSLPIDTDPNHPAPLPMPCPLAPYKNHMAWTGCTHPPPTAQFRHPAQRAPAAIALPPLCIAIGPWSR